MNHDLDPTSPPAPRPWDRQPRAWAVGAWFAGAALGGLTILAPGVHLVGTWLFPLLGSIAALWLWRRPATDV